MRLRIIAAAVVAIGILLSGAGCSHSPVAPGRTDTNLEATSPQNAVRRLEWAINTRNVDAVDGLLTDDFTFIAAGTDSAGNPVRSIWRRDTLFAAIEGLLVGSAERPSAESVTVSFDGTLLPLPDPRPGKVSKWHKTIMTSVVLFARVDANNSFEVTGSARFFLTRGDSAAIPARLKARGVAPDSLRWWIDRWEDETVSGGIVKLSGSAHRTVPPGVTMKGRTTRAHPVRNITFGAVLRFYLP